MPIVLPAPENGPLEQGDILNGITMISTGLDEGPLTHDSILCVVLSRDCVAMRANTVLVAPIIKYKGPIADAAGADVSFDASIQHMNALRDGDSRPNEVYIGPLDGVGKRSCIAINEIYTITLPALREDKNDREAWVTKHRVKRLDFPFIRHLQIRIGISLQRQGFDDFQWWSTEDLKLVLKVGEAEVAALGAKKTALEAEAVALKAAGDGKASKIEKDILKSESQKQKVLKKIATYNAEVTRREA